MDLKKGLVSIAYQLEASKKYKSSKAFVYEVLEDSDSPKKRYFDILMIFLVISTIMIFILEIKHTIPPWVYQYEMLAVSVFIVEWLCRLWVSSTGYKTLIQTHQSNPKLSLFGLLKPAFLEKMRFMLSPMAIIDLLAILPTYRPLRVLRIFLLFRLFKVFRYTNSLNFLLHVFVEKRFEFLTLLMLFGFMVFFASTTLYIFEGAGENEKIDNFYHAIYWAVITITTVGYGDVTPVTNEGRFITMLLIIGGIGIISFMTSIMTSAMTQKLQEAKSYRVISEVNKLKHYILIYGYGKMGKVLASELHDAGEPFVIVDEDEVRIEEAKAENYLALQADINAQRVLEDLRCEEKVEYAVILGHSDVSNLSTILSLKALSPSMHIFARCNDHAVKNKLEFAGAKEVIYPYATAAHVGIEHIEKGREDKRVIIYGYAKTAHMILEAFDMRAKEVLLVVPHETKAIEARKAGFEVEVLNLAVDENLHKVGIGEEKDEVLFCLSRDFEQNLFVTLSARALDSKLEIISLCATESEAKKMKLAGANHTINPYEIGSKRIERLINKERKEHLIAK